MLYFRGRKDTMRDKFHVTVAKQRKIDSFHQSLRRKNQMSFFDIKRFSCFYLHLESFHNVEFKRQLDPSLMEASKEPAYQPFSPNYDLNLPYFSPDHLVHQVLDSIHLSMDPRTEVKLCCGENRDENKEEGKDILHYCYGCLSFWRCFQDATHLKCTICRYRRCLSARCIRDFRDKPCLGCGLYHCRRHQDNKCSRCLCKENGVERLFF